VPEYVKTGVKLIDAQHGQFWIEDCEAIDDGTTSGVLTGLWRGQVIGLEQIVQDINPRAVVTKVQADGRRRFVYDIRIDPRREPAPVSSMSEIVGAFGLLEVDLSEHIYTYEN
jgi:hypothetical protein